jgi:hypothetical protein
MNIEPAGGGNPLMASGKAVHETVEAMLKGVAPTPEAAAAYAESVLQREFATREDQHDLIAKYLPGAVRAVSRFPAELFTQPGWSIEAEAAHTYPVATPEGITVFGYPDFVLYSPEEVVIYELKSTSNTDKRPQDYFLWNPQHRYYATLIADSKAEGRPVYVEYIVVQTGKGEAAGLAGQQLRWLMKDKLIDECRRELLVTLEELAVLPIVPAYNYMCRGCDYARLCEARIIGASEESVIAEHYMPRERRQG